MRWCTLNRAIATLIIMEVNNNRRLVTLAEHTSDHGKQTNSSIMEVGWGEILWRGLRPL